MPERDVADLAAAMIDGEVIDWAAAQARLSSSREQSVAEELKTLSHLDTVRGVSTSRPASRRLPALLEAMRWVAVICTFTGLIGEVLALQQVESARLGVMFSVLVVFAGTALFLDMGGSDRRARALAACYWATAASFSASGVRWLAQSWPDLQWLRLLASIHPEAFFAACLWQFGRDFPVMTRFGRLDRVCLAGLRLTLALGVFLFTANLVPVLAPGSLIDAWIAPFQRMSGYGPGFWNLAFGAAIPALVVIARRGRLSTGQEALRVRIFLYALASSVAPVVMEVVAEGVFPPFARSMQTPSGHRWGGLIIYPPMFALPVVTAYAVAVHNVLEVRVVIQRGLRYLLARWLVMWGAAIPLIMLLVYLYRHSSRPLREVLTDPTARILIWLDVAAIVALAFRQKLVRALDSWALPGMEDPSVILAHMTERMKQTRTPLEVTSVLARGAERALQAPADAYLVRENGLVPVRDGSAPPPAQSLVRVLLEGAREPCVVSARHGQSYHSLLSERDRAWIADQGIAVLLPILSGRGGGGLLGMIALKNRRNALAFSQDDLRFLRAATASASLACDVVQSRGISGTVGTTPEEVAIQCTRCGRVDVWEAFGQTCGTCGDIRWEPAVLPKQLLGRFEVTRKLGAGGMGVVYCATDITLGREVAVKTLTRLSEDAARRLILEARAMAGLAHPNIAVLYGSEIWRGTPLLIMEYLAGSTLSARLQRGAMDPRAAVKMARRLAEALAHVHRAEQYHGDIKPSNIGFTLDNVPKFLDFGLSRAITKPYGERTDEKTHAGATNGVAGTLAYMSPEVRDGAAPGPILDVWALSLVLCESLKGKPILSGTDASTAVTRHISDAVSSLPQSVLPGLRGLLNGALAALPQRHPQAAAELVKALDDIDVGGSSSETDIHLCEE